MLRRRCHDAGIDEELVALLGQHAPLPVTYAGGARTLVRHLRLASDLRQVLHCGSPAVRIEHC